jgi:SAM-dependent methyltransferase
MARREAVATKDELAALYGPAYFGARQRDSKRERMYQQEYARVLTRTGLTGGRVLDIGCGLGEFLDLLPSDRWEKYGIEIAPYAIAVCERKGIAFALPAEPGAFDLVILRGSLQHLDRPLDTLFKCYDWLRPGGWLCVLATPNAGSIVYRLFQDLPALDPPRNFVVFSDKILRQCLLNIGFRDIAFVYPYLDTPYASPLKDHLFFLLRCFGVRKKFAFWGNMMECYARR